MFKSKKEFAQAMLDGRVFVNANGSKYFYDETKNQPFRLNASSLHVAWDDYNQVHEVTEPFKPEEREEILVSMDGDYWEKRIFIGMFGDWYLCKAPRDVANRPISWKHAKPIEQELEEWWINEYEKASYAHTEKDKALRRAEKTAIRTAVHVREVPDNDRDKQ